MDQIIFKIDPSLIDSVIDSFELVTSKEISIENAKIVIFTLFLLLIQEEWIITYRQKN